MGPMLAAAHHWLHMHPWYMCILAPVAQTYDVIQQMSVCNLFALPCLPEIASLFME